MNGTRLAFRRRVLLNWRCILVVVVPVLFYPIFHIYQTKTSACAYTILIMASYWMTEAIPIPITALIPVVLYPMFGIADTVNLFPLNGRNINVMLDAITREYLKDSIMVFIGGLLVALAFEFSHLHQRVALRVMVATGASLAMLMLGTMLTTMFLSMWMFNTAATAMMVPIIQAVVDELQKSLEDAYGSKVTNEAESGHGESQGSTAMQSPMVETESNHNQSIDRLEMRNMTLLQLPSVEESENPLATDHSSLDLNPSTLSTRTVPPDDNLSTGWLTDNCVDSIRNSVTITETSPPVIRSELEKKEKILQAEECIRNIRIMFLLSTCYSSNIGGTGVITGTSTNLVALEFLGDLDPKHHGDYASLTFATWAAFNFLPMILNILIAWLYLQLVYLGIPVQWRFWRSKKQREEDVANKLFNPELESKIEVMLKRKYDDLGPITLHEVGVAGCFGFAVIIWVLHDPKFIPGWSELFYGGSKTVSIATATLIVGVMFFFIPRNKECYESFFNRGGYDGEMVRMKPLLEWSFVQERLPWGVILLLGGGYALSKGAKLSGLNAAIGQSLRVLSALPQSLILLTVMTIIAFLTEVTSNSATATIVVPILLEMSKELQIHPLYLTLPATVTCSYAFMLPVATPPNSIVYGASDMKVIEMIKTGFFMNIACVFVLYICTNLYGNLFFNFNDYKYTP